MSEDVDTRVYLWDNTHWRLVEVLNGNGVTAIEYLGNLTEGTWVVGRKRLSSELELLVLLAEGKVVEPFTPEPGLYSSFWAGKS